MAECLNVIRDYSNTYSNTVNHLKKDNAKNHFIHQQYAFFNWFNTYVKYALSPYDKVKKKIPLKTRVLNGEFHNISKLYTMKCKHMKIINRNYV